MLQMSVCNVTGSGRVVASLTLPVQVSSYDGLQWSEDNQLAVSTNKGVYVFEITPDVRRNVNSIHFVKTFVPNETELEPWQMKSVLTETELMSLERSRRSEVMMDRIMSPHMAAGEVTFKQPSRVGWTPHSISQDKCGLIILTVDRRFKIYHQVGRKWLPKIDISQKLYQYLSSKPAEKLFSKNSNLTEQESVVKNVENKLYSLATSCWCWTRGPGHVGLVSGQMSGHVVQYNVSGDQISVGTLYKTQLQEISCIQYHVVNNIQVLIVAGNDGRVEMLKLDKKKISSLGFLWPDLDRLIVNKIVVIDDNDTSYVVLAKANFCVQLKVKIVNGSKLEVGKPCSYNTGMTRIVGMEVYSDKLVVTNQKSALKICDINKLSLNGTIQLELSRDNYFCQGMSVTPSKSVFAVVDNIASFNDHLVVREPARLIFWTLESEESIRSMLEDRSQELSRYADVLECYRCLVSPTSPAPATSSSLISLWWHHHVIVTKTVDEDVKKDLGKHVIKYETELRCKAAIENITDVDNKDSASKAASAKFVVQFSKNNQQLSVAESYLRNSPTVSWQCKICGAEENISIRHVSVVTCQSGHVWPRCVATQQPVHITCPSRCGWCKSLSSLSDSRRCDLCQGPMLRSRSS